MKNTEIDALMDTARKTFMEELRQRTEGLAALVTINRGRPAEATLPQLVKFFHQLQGTASTLGFHELAVIGRAWEQKLRSAGNTNNFGDKSSVEDLQQTILQIKKIIDAFVPSAATSPMAGAGVSGGKGSILLVDDDVTILKLLENALTGEGYTVTICDEPARALELIAIAQPDLVMLDVMMPQVGGYQLLHELKARPEYGDIFIVFLSAMDEYQEKLKGLKAGADDYITKPFIIEEVLLRVEAILRRRQK